VAPTDFTEDALGRALINNARTKVLARQVTLGVRWDRKAQHLHRKLFPGEADAQRAWTEWPTTSAAWKGWTGTGAPKSAERRHRRQGGGGLETVTEGYWEITRGGANSEIVEQETLLESLFVLIANAPEHSAKDALMAYTRQTPVEPDHHTLNVHWEWLPYCSKTQTKSLPMSTSSLWRCGLGS